MMMNSGPTTIRFNAANHPVKSVLVLKSSKAEIVRTFDVALKSGQNKIVISKLSSTIDTESVRISGLSTGTAKSGNYLSDVVCSVLDVPDDAADGPIQALETRKVYLEREKSVLDTQAGVLVKYSNSLNGKRTSPDVMTTFLNAFVDQGKTYVKAITKVEAEIAEIDKQIKEEKKKATLLKGSANAEVTAVITADTETRVNLKLIYIVNQTNWTPTYELHAVTGNDGRPSRTVSLHYRASVVQTTGEDWTDASLTLSTAATDAIVKAIPRHNPVWIRVTYANAGRSQAFPPAQQKAFPDSRWPMNQNTVTALSNTGGSLFGAQQPPPPVPEKKSVPWADSFSGYRTEAGGGGSGGLFGMSQQRQPVSASTFGSQSASSFGAQSTPLFGGQSTSLFGGQSTSSVGAQHHPHSTPVPQPQFGATPAVQAHAFGGSAFSSNQTDLGVIPLPEEDEEGSDDGGEEGPTKLVNQTPMALTYAVHGRSSIPSDGKKHVVTIAMLTFEMHIDYVSVPRVDPRIYLQCQVKNNSEYRLLTGPVSVILDDSYVSKTTIFDVNRNDTFKFTLGDDPSILVSYARSSNVTKEGSGSFADVANITTYTTTIKVQNKHPFHIDNLIIRNALPVTQDKRVRVVLRKPKELIEAKDGVLVKIKGEETAEEGSGEDEEGKYSKVKWTKEKTGLYEYHWRVDADDKIELETVFEMKASADLHCYFNETASGFGVYSQ